MHLQLAFVSDQRPDVHTQLVHDEEVSVVCERATGTSGRGGGGRGGEPSVIMTSRRCFRFVFLLLAP